MGEKVYQRATIFEPTYLKGASLKIASKLRDPMAPVGLKFGNVVAAS